MARRLFSLVGGAVGQWRVLRMETLRGEALPKVAYVDSIEGEVAERPASVAWVLRGVTSYERYVHRAE